MFGALKRGFRSMASLILVSNVVCELQPKRTLAASRGFLAAARLSCSFYLDFLDYYVYVLQYYVKIMYIYAALDDSHYFFIFHRMLTATEKNMYFDF